ncbi:MAG: hypothetical protein WCK36_02715 [Candidatus Firestonebacteria bacterium]
MTITDILNGAWGVFLGFLLGLGNSFFRQYLAVRLLKTEKKKAVAFISIFSLLRLGLILLVIYLLIRYSGRVMALGALGGLILHTILVTFKYTKLKKKD